MASASFRNWETRRAAELDAIAAAHGALGGTGRGRRWVARQIIQSYALLLYSQYQAFCRDLHSESVDSLVLLVQPAGLRATLRREFVFSRRLDRGNPTPGNIGADFMRLGIPFWESVRHDDIRNTTRQSRLEELSAWRNAIAHQDFESGGLRPSRLTLQTVKRWRGACHGLARSFDRVMARYIGSISGASPW